MKKQFFVAMLLMLALPTMAQKDKKCGKCSPQVEQLAGIWQQCVVMNQEEKTQMFAVPQFKILNKDGSFSNMALDKNALATIYVSGSWKVMSDSTFVEHLETILTDESSTGKDNELTFHLLENGKFMQVSYTLPGNGKQGKELWIRVEKGQALKN